MKKSLKQHIIDATLDQLAKISLKLMLGQGPRLHGQRVLFSYEDVKGLILKHRPEIDWAEIDQRLSEVSI